MAGWNFASIQTSTKDSGQVVGLLEFKCAGMGELCSSPLAYCTAVGMQKLYSSMLSIVAGG